MDTTTQLVARLIGAVIGGTLCGLIPYFFGRKRGQPTLGIVGLVSCIVGGLIAGLILALPVAGVFALVIAVRKGEGTPPGATPGAPPGAPPGPGHIG
ncbi:MAG TPA: hypothetical protein VGQ94_09775 [Terriglobales bacterium]|nr:hypothetical protein [Terriglobales bacterium]